MLPGEFKKYFWDVKFKKISLSKDIDLILRRILSFGDTIAVRWLLERVKRARIKKYLASYGARQLDKRSFNLWNLYLDFPANKK